MYILKCWHNNRPIDRTTVPVTMQAAVPARFDFIGGWTDTPPYYFDNPARVLNASLSFGENGDRPGWGGRAICVTVTPSAELRLTENGIAVDDISEHIVMHTTLEYLGLRHPPIHIAISNSIPKGSGLGGSSLLTAAVLAALRGYYSGLDAVAVRLGDLVNNVLLIEQLMKSGGGWQDQIGGVVPGVKLIETGPQNPCDYAIRYIDKGIGQLNERSLIIDTRIQRKAARILCSIRRKYIDGDSRAVSMLRRITDNALLGFRFLRDGNIADFAGLLTESWEMVNSVESGSLEIIERLRDICGRHLCGLKVGGAGGGGFVLVIFPDSDSRDFYRERIQGAFPDCRISIPVFGGAGLALRRKTESGVETRHAGFERVLRPLP